MTSKPTAFNFRTWDVNSFMYVSCQDSLTPLIRVDSYQRKIVRVLPLDDWISDSQRFLFLNLDKQTLKFPGLIFKLNSSKIFEKTKKLLRQHTYTSVINYLVKRINKKRKSKLSLNLILGSLFAKNINHYYRLSTSRTAVNFFAKNSFLQNFSNPQVQDYSDILLLNVNPRLDSPLFDLSLKDLDTDVFSIKSIGNFQSNFEIVTNNIKSVLSLGTKSLLVYSETNKDNKFVFGAKNDKYNISPVYLNNSLVFNKKPFESNIQAINFNLGLSLELSNNKNFNVNFSTHIFELNFDIYLPINNYFVSSGDLITIKGGQKLRMVRPSFSLEDHIKSLSIILNKKRFFAKKSFIKVYDFVINSKIFCLNNRLSFFDKKILPLQK
ncbi:MAG: hypothetical protein EOP33_06620 [Rickettsiaceae bacterium]|nr:MAG: hypothetical protein EOP33_06620 [Rickettsiaceae bacterium]